MPRVLKWVGDAMETILATKYLSVVVTKVESLSPEIRKVSFKGDFYGVDFTIGYAVAFRVNEVEFRNYTPASWEPETGICKIMFHLHSDGPGSNFALKLKEGDSMKMILPRGKSMHRPEKPLHFLFGDETSLGLCSLLAGKLKDSYQTYTGILELEQENLPVPGQLGLTVKPILKSQNQIRLRKYLENVRTLYPQYLDQGVFYLTGNAASIQLFRKVLRQEQVSSKNIITQAYWAEGKKGL